jgi:hypothetical protein
VSLFTSETDLDATKTVKSDSDEERPLPGRDQSFVNKRAVGFHKSCAGVPPLTLFGQQTRFSQKGAQHSYVRFHGDAYRQRNSGRFCQRSDEFHVTVFFRPVADSHMLNYICGRQQISQLWVFPLPLPLGSCSCRGDDINE